MKKLFMVLILTVLCSLSYGQKSIETLFDKYSGMDGFVKLEIKGNLLKSFTLPEAGENNFWPDDLTEIRILVQDDECKSEMNFLDILENDINLRGYEEFMRITESEQDLRIMVMVKDDIVREFLLVGKGEKNVLIQVKGNMTRKDAKRFSSGVTKDFRINQTNGNANIRIM